MSERLDQRADCDPTVDEIEAEFPAWHAWRGANAMYYGQLVRSSPPITLREENTVELRARIASWHRMNPQSVTDDDWPKPPWESSIFGKAKS